MKPTLEDLAARRAAAASESLKMGRKLAANALYNMCILNKQKWKSLPSTRMQSGGRWT